MTRFNWEDASPAEVLRELGFGEEGPLDDVVAVSFVRRVGRNPTLDLLRRVGDGYVEESYGLEEGEWVELHPNGGCHHDD